MLHSLDLSNLQNVIVAAPSLFPLTHAPPLEKSPAAEQLLQSQRSTNSNRLKHRD